MRQTFRETTQSGRTVDLGTVPSLEATLLRVLNADPHDVDSSARELDRAIGPTDPDLPTSRLLATLLPQLRHVSVESRLPEIASKGYLVNRVNNSGLFSGIVPVIDALQQAGCRPTLLKGAAMIVAYYRDLGLRALADADVLVDPRCAPVAWGVLSRLGGTPERRGSLVDFSAVRAAFHGWQFTFPGFAIDLHWSPLCDCCSDDVADAFLRSARPASHGGLAAMVPCPEHLLLHTAVHAARRDWWAPSRGLLDSARIVSDTPGLDWRTIWSLAETVRLEGALRAVLQRIAEAIELPGAAWAPAATPRVQPWRRVELWAWRRDELSFERTPVARLVCHASRYWRLRRFHPAWRSRGWLDYWQLHRAEKGA